MQTLTILGATGSIGLSTLDVIERHPEQFCLYAVTAHSNVQGMLDICLKFKPEVAVMVEEQAAELLENQLKEIGSPIKVLSGASELENVAAQSNVTTVMAAIVGSAGLMPTLTAANAGNLLLQAVKDNGAILLPVDSEHNAIFQAMPESVQKGQSLKSAGVEKILLTGSGGPFLTKALNEFEHITPKMAVAHPNWSMGAKISVDSATMMNKGLEFIEARLLFNAEFEQVQVIVHPQSIIHSMVSYSDGSVIAQMGQPDMRTPIAHTLAYPQRITSGVEPLDFTKVASFTFCQPDYERFPNLKFALDASKSGQSATTVLNASNEVAVAAFLASKISFNDIAQYNEQSLIALAHEKSGSLTEILALDSETRRYASHAMKI